VNWTGDKLEVTRREVLFTGQYLSIIKKYFQTEKGEYFWETVERTRSKGDAVVIIPITGDGELILERNWRAASEQFVIQFPAGLNDKTGETEEEVARRELLEETGYLARELIPILRAPESPALISTGLSHYLAPGVVWIGCTNPDFAENIEVIKIPLNKVKDYLLNLPPDTCIDLRVPGILWFLEKSGSLKSF